MNKDATRDDGFAVICKSSDQAVDPAVKVRLKGMMGKPDAEIKDELLGLIDDIVYHSWTSGMEILMLSYLWKNAGGTEEELEERNNQLDDPAKAEEFQKRFKWER